MTLVSDIGTSLQSGGYGTIGTDIFYYDFPDLPHNAICIIDGTIRPPKEFLHSGGIDYPHLQIQVRNTVKATAQANAEAVRLYLNRKTISGLVQTITSTSKPVYLGKDEGTARFRFVIEFTVSIVR